MQRYSNAVCKFGGKREFRLTVCVIIDKMEVGSWDGIPGHYLRWCFFEVFVGLG